jgi:hypothetical protein
MKNSPKSARTCVRAVHIPYLFVTAALVALPSRPAISRTPYWYSIGPAAIDQSPYANEGQASGRVAAVAVDPSHPAHFLIGAAQGGIWESFDSGSTWYPRTDAQASMAMGAITFAPSKPAVVYAGTGEPNFRADAYAGAGLLVSYDGGTHWGMRNSTFGKTSFSAIRVDTVFPSLDPTLVAVATVRGNAGVADQASSLDSPPGAPLPGVFISTDSGTTFSHPLTGQATDLAVQPGSFNHQYAALGEIYGATENGVYRTLNQWSTSQRINGPWTALATPAHMGRIVMALAPSDPNTLYVAVAGKRTAYIADLLGIWRTSNAWDPTPTWTALPPAPIVRDSSTMPTTPRSWYYFALLVDPINSGIVYLCDYDVLSYDGLWTPVGAVHPDNHAMAWVPVAGNPARLLVGNDGGVWLSDVGGWAPWQDLNPGLATCQIHKGAVQPVVASGLFTFFQFGSHLTLAGFQDNGSADFTGSTVWKFKNGGDGGDCAISSANPATDWVVSLQGGEILRTLDGGANFQLCWDGITDLQPVATQFFVHFEKSPRNDDIFIAGTTRLYRCNYFFSSPIPQWFPNSPPMVHAGAPDAISAMAFAPSDLSSLTYAFGTENGQLRITTDGGFSWSDLNLGNGVPARYVSGLAFSPWDPNVLYVTLSGFDQSTPGQPGHLFKTQNALAFVPFWVNVSPPVNLPNNCLAIDPVNASTIYVGTDQGVWVSYDGSASWVHHGPAQGMPNVAVFDLRMNFASEVTAFTHGRGAFILQYPLFPPPVDSGTVFCRRCLQRPCLLCFPDWWAALGQDSEIDLPLSSILPLNTVDLTATLLPSAQITPLNGTQTYGVLVGQGPPVSRTFVFRAMVETNLPGAGPGDTVPLIFQLRDQSNYVGLVSVPFRLGTPVYPLAQDFEQAQVGLPPPGWGTTNAGALIPWLVTSNPPPNSLFGGEGEDAITTSPTNNSVSVPADGIGESYLTSPSFNVIGTRAQLYFLEAFNLSNLSDGGVLEISIANQPFEDIVQAGGSFVQDGYNAVLTNSNPLGANSAWTGDSGGWLPVYVNLPADAAGQQVQLRWHLATSQGLTNGFWFLDNVVVTDPLFPEGTPPAPPVQPGCALNFDGISSMVQLGGAALSPPWTAEFWVNRQPAFDDSAILIGDSDTALKLEQSPYTGQVGFTQFGVADYFFNYIAPTGSWTHLAFVTTTNTQLFVNGVLQDTQPAAVALGLGQLGADIPGRYASHLRGQMDEVRIWSVARDPADIQATMNRSLVGTETGLAAYWRLDECGGPFIYDATGVSTNPAILSGGVSWVASTAPFAPIVATLPASGLANQLATLNGTVNPNGVPTTCWFEWGGPLGYTNSSPPLNLGGVFTNVPVSAKLTGLAPGGAYHFHVIASSSAGRTDGLDSQFIQPPPASIDSLVSGGNLVLSWPSNYTGWLLQAQTNALRPGNWVDISGSGTSNSITIPLDIGNPSVFYRLRSP